MKKILVILTVVMALWGCSSSRSSGELPPIGPVEIFATNSSGSGQMIQLNFIKGVSHNHPLMAVWVEDMDGNYIQSLFVAKSIATGVFAYGKEHEGKWAPGERRRPAALPYWGHKRGIRALDGLFVPDATTPVPDAYSGATPKSSFTLQTRLDQPAQAPFKILFELNQSWDWNNYWSNTKYPEDEHYRTSSQPAVVYAATLNPAETGVEVNLQPIGRSHHSGQDGALYNDLHTLTTALQIAATIQAKILP